MKKFQTVPRSMRLLEDVGYRCEIVERFIPGANIRKDLLGCIDLLCFQAKSKNVIGVQVFTTAWKEHERKICEEYPGGAELWLSYKRHRLIFIGWRKLKAKRGGKAFRWMPRFGYVRLSKKGKLALIESGTLKECLK